MNEDLLKKYVESTRDCDSSLLESAVSKGLQRAKSGGMDYKRLLSLAAACAATIVLCVAMVSEPISTASAEIIRNNSRVTQSESEALYRYLTSVSTAAIQLLGGN